MMIMVIEDEDERDFMADLYREYRLLLFSEIRKVINDSWVTEDLVQDVLVKLIDKVELLHSLTRVQRTSYIVTAAKNTARDYIRKKMRTPVTFLEEYDDIPIPDFNIEEVVLNKVTMDNLLSSWPSLPEDVQEILERKYILQQSDEEIGAAFGIKPSSVRMRLTRARRLVFETIIHPSAP